MSNKKDSVFQISITEIAFTLVLLLVLLLGVKLMNSHTEVERQRRTIEEQTQQIRNFQTLLSQFGGICSPDANDPIDPMMPCNKCVSVVGKISKEEAANAIDIGRKIMEQWNARHKPEVTFQSFHDQLLKVAAHLAEDDKPVFAEENEMVEKINSLEKEISHLNATVESSRSELEKLMGSSDELEKNLQTCLTSNAYYKRRSGLDNPPCWVSSSNKPGYIFNVTLLPNDKVIVEQGWSEEFATKAAELQPVQQIRGFFGKEIPLSQFLPIVSQMKDIGDNTKPEACRHFVRLKSTIPDRPTADRARLQIENGFYKYEVQ